MLVLTLIVLAVVLPTWFGHGLGAGWRWDLGNGLGLAAFVLILYLHIDRGRGRQMARHQAIGWCAVAVAAGHALYFLIDDPLVVEYLKPTAPLYMWAGTVALTGLALLAWTSGTRLRRRLFAGSFRLEHWLVSILLLAGSLWHILGSAFYYTHLASQLWLVLLAGVAASAPRWLPASDHPGGARTGVWLSVAVTGLTALLLALPGNLL